MSSMVTGNFQHFEAFGGALINNFIGYISNAWTSATAQFFFEPSNVISIFIIFSLLSFMFVLIKTWDIGKASNSLINTDGNWVIDNVVVKSVIVFLVFMLVLKPVPVIQMTPIIGYTESASATGVNDGDRVLKAWMVNDIKTTTNLYNPFSDTAMTAPGTAGVNDEIMYVPQIFMLLGMFENFYYGFPDVKNEDIFTLNVDPAKTDFENLRYKTTIASGIPTLFSCVKSEYTSKITGMENKMNASIYLKSEEIEGDKLVSPFKEACVTKMKATDNGWTKTAQESLFVSLFGLNEVSQILSDFFEPVDRLFYYLSMKGIDELLYNKRNNDSSEIKSSKFHDELINEISNNYSKEYKERIITISIQDKLLAGKTKTLIEELKKVINQYPVNAQPKETFQMLVDSIFTYHYTNPQGWRKNHPSIDPNEYKAIKLIQHQGLAGDALRIAETERKILSGEYGSGIEQKNIEKAVDFDNIKYLDLLEIFYSEANTSLGMQNTKVLADYKIEEGDTEGNILALTTKYNSMTPEDIGTLTPFTIEVLQATSGSAKTLSNQDYVDFHKRLFLLEKEIINRNILNNYIDKYKISVEAILTKIGEVKTGCVDSSPKESTPEFINNCVSADFKKSSQVVLGDSNISMVYAGMYPANIYQNDDTHNIKDNKDKTQKVLFVPVEEIIKVFSNENPVIETHQERLPLLSDYISGSFWNKTSLSKDEFIFIKESASITSGSDIMVGRFKDKIEEFSKIDNTKLTNKSPILTMGIVSTTNNGILLNWDISTADGKEASINLNSQFSEILGNYFPASVNSVNTSGVSYNKIHDFVGRDIVNSAVNSAEKFDAIRKEYQVETANLLNSNNYNRANFKNDYISLLLSLKNFTTQKEKQIIFDEKTQIMLLETKMMYKDYKNSPTAEPAVIQKTDVSKPFMYVINNIIETEYKKKFPQSLAQLEAALKKDIDALSLVQINKTTERTTLQEKISAKQGTINNTIKQIAYLIKQIEDTPDTFICWKSWGCHPGDNKSLTKTKEFYEQTLVVLNQANSDLETQKGEATEAVSTAGKGIKVKTDTFNRMKKDSLITGEKDGGIFNSLVTILWGGFTEILTPLRELQNKTMVYYSSNDIQTTTTYQPDLLLGNVPQAKTGGTMKLSGTLVKTINPNIIPRDYSEETDDLIQKIMDTPYAESLGWTAGGVVGGSVAVAAISSAGTALNNSPNKFNNFAGKLISVIMIILTVILAIITLALKIVINTVKIIFLGIYVGMMGFLRASILVPFSSIMWLLMHDIGGGKIKTKEEYRNIYKKNGYLDPFSQTKLAFKQLMGWVVSITVMAALLKIDFYFIAGLQKELAFEAWIGSLMGSNLIQIKSIILTLFLSWVYLTLIVFGYGLINNYFKKVNVSDPMLDSVKAMWEQQKEMARSMRKMNSGGS